MGRHPPRESVPGVQPFVKPRLWPECFPGRLPGPEEQLLMAWPRVCT